MRFDPLVKFVTERLEGTYVFVPLRHLYHRIFKPRVAKQRLDRIRFFRKFVRSGSLVFDVGANYGEYAHVFTHLGAKVVALEPNPSCAKILARRRTKDLTVRCQAVGEREGEITLFLGARSGHSTVSPEWMERAVTTGDEYNWNDALTVTMTTLDQLQREHGTPDFVKIDVEGYEASVFRGMSFRPRALSFEFHACALDQLSECLDLLFDRGMCSFNLVVDGDWRFVFQEWQDRNAVLDFVAKLPKGGFGDIYAV